MVWERKNEVSEQDKIDCVDALDLLSDVVNKLGKVRRLLVTNSGSNMGIWNECCAVQRDIETIQDDLNTSLRCHGEQLIIRRNL